jgi:Cu/Ag efflux pump CusA
LDSPSVSEALSSRWRAWLILGGLITSTVLNLVVLPTMALRFAKFVGSPEV